MKTTAAAVVAALLSFFIGNIWVFISADMFVGYFYEARMVALTHVFTLGWVSLMIVGVLRQLGPVAFGLKLHGAGLIGAAVALWIPAVAVMVIGFATLRYRLAAAGTTLVFVAILAVVTVFVSGFRGIRRELPHNHLLAALLYFTAAAFLGAWMALAKGFEAVVLPAPFHRVLFAHIHLAGAGWAGMTILAVMSRLFPQPHLRRAVQARVRFVAFNAGLIGMSAGLLWGSDSYPIFGALLAVACISYAFAFIPVLREFGQPSDGSTAFLIASWSCLIVVALMGIWFGLLVSMPTPFSTQIQFTYGFVYLFGWLTLMIVGMLYRIIPTHVSKLLTARGLTGGAVRRAFVDPGMQRIVLIVLVLGLILSSAGIVTQNVVVFRFGWAAWLTGILGFVWALARLAIELRSILQLRKDT